MRKEDAFSTFIVHFKYFSLSVIGLNFQLARYETSVGTKRPVSSAEQTY